MKFGSVLALLALVALTPSVPATAAKDDKLPRCNGRQKRPANPYGTILPTLPDRAAPATGAVSGGVGVPRGTPGPQGARSTPPVPATNLFPAPSAMPSPQGPDTPQGGQVPPIGVIGFISGPSPSLQISYASC